MKIGIVIYSNDPETVWNAFRFGNYAVKEGDSVATFLIGKGVESETLDTDAFDITEQMRSFIGGGGTISASRRVSPSTTWEARNCVRYRRWQICMRS
jgi:hypothetical protein